MKDENEKQDMICMENFFEEIAVRTNAALAAGNLRTEHLRGTLDEVMNRLAVLEQQQQGYGPLIAMITPYRRLVGTGQGQARAMMRFVVVAGIPAGEAAAVNPEDASRCLREVVCPVYEAFVAEIRRSGFFCAGRMTHTVINHFGIGKDVLDGYGGSVYATRAVGVEIQDMELDIKTNQCKIKNF